MDFFYTHISERSLKLVHDVLISTRVSAGKLAEEFEAGLEHRLGLRNPVSVNSGTSALHLALAVAGVGPGDEVILPAQTFIATGFVIMMQGAKPVFADIEYETGNISVASVRERITSRTKAIIPVHWGGYPCDLDEINQLADDASITVIEDAAHALGAQYKGRAIGSISRFTAFSFQAIKHLTTGDGGALCCIDEAEAKEAKRRRWFDIDRESAAPGFLGERIYNATNVGFKYHMNDLAAALGLANLGDIGNILDRHRQIAGLYYTGLADIDGITLPRFDQDRQSSFWLFTLLADRRDDLIRALQSRGIPSSVVHQGIDKNDVFQADRYLPDQRKFDQHQLAIPIHSGLSDADVSAVIAAIKMGW